MPSEQTFDGETSDRVRVRLDDRVVTLTLNRPEVLNAIDAATLAALGDAVDRAGQDDRIGALVLTGAGDRAFAAGADLRELVAETPLGAQAFARRAQAVFARIETLGKPVLAAINGFALGGGCELAMACTLRLAADSASFAQPEINLGLIPGYGGTQRLPRLVGRGRALELLLTGDRISAEEAWRIGLVNRVVPAERLLDEAQALAATLAAKPPIARRSLLAAVIGGAGLSLAEGQEYEAALFGLVAATEDMREGTRAFLEKRRPTFTGR
jgi:enoyl-CoA hydratase